MGIRLAMAQMFVEPGALEANVARAEEWIVKAAEQGADVVLLPECLDVGWAHSSTRDLATPVLEGATCRRLSCAARDSGVFVCAGFAERDASSLYNAAVLVDPSGRVLLHHRKINELDFAREVYATGDRLGVADTSFGKVGLMICADGFATGQVISRSLAEMGARIILSPCAWAVPADHDNTLSPYGKLWMDNYGPVCREFGITIAGCSNIGPITTGHWAGRRCIGASMVVGQGGEMLCQLPYNAEHLTVLDIDV